MHKTRRTKPSDDTQIDSRSARPAPGRRPLTGRRATGTAPPIQRRAAGPTGASGPGVASDPDMAAAHGAPAGTMYTVQAGDTLGAIAQRLLGDPGRYREIFAANRDTLPSPDRLQVGQRLLIPAQGEAAPAPAEAEAETEAAAEEAPAGQTYTVQAGDTLGAIARRFLGDPGRFREIFEANRDTLPDPNTLRVGQVLRIPGVAGGPGPSEADSAAPAAAPAPEPRPDPPEAQAPAEGAAPEREPEQSPETAEPAVEQAPGAGATPAAASSGPAGLAITDANALVRTDPPELRSTGEVIPVGTAIEIVASAVKGRSEYVKVRDDSGRMWGWTAKSNLGSGREFDASLVPEGQIDLAGLRGLDRTMAQIHNAKGGYLERKASELGIALEDAGAVLKVESGGSGFGASGDMIIRFENHKFFQFWGRDNREVFDRHFSFNSGRVWTGHTFRRGESEERREFHGNQASEWEVLGFARGLDDTAALKSISMGAAQIMGFNFEEVGYGSVQEMFEAMNGAIRPQLEGLFDFIAGKSICISGLRARNYVRFASGYNGSGQAAEYGRLIEQASQAYARVLALRNPAGT